jgi:hypothetical protein
MRATMSLKNKYVKRSKISEAKFRKLVQHFASDLDAKAIASLAGLNRNTVNRYLALIRERIAEFCLRESPLKGGDGHTDSHLDRKDANGEKGLLAYAKTPLFGVFRCRDKVCTLIIPRGDSGSEGFCGCRETASPGNSDEQDRDYAPAGFADHENFIHGIQSFLAFTRNRLMKFHGIPVSTFYLHLKECEFRFNYRNEDLYPILLKIIRDNPLC